MVIKKNEPYGFGRAIRTYNVSSLMENSKMEISMDILERLTIMETVINQNDKMVRKQKIYKTEITIYL